MRLPHVIPFARTPIYFFTACTAGRKILLANPKAHACLREIWSRSDRLDGWYVERFMLMPDHVHFFASPLAEAKPRGDWIKTWKSISARRLLSEFKTDGAFWQADTFDHLLRSAESYTEKWEYVRANPVRQGLVVTPEEWPWQGEIHSLAF